MRGTVRLPLRLHDVVLKETAWSGRAMAQAVSRLFDPGSVHMGFLVDKVALGQVFPLVLLFLPVSFIPQVLHYLEK
jgi:hypothetical protein